MNQPNLNIEILAVPQPIKEKLRDLSQSVFIEKQSKKGACGWLFFGRNKIHNQRVAIKFYDWGGDSTYHAEPRHLAAINSENVIAIQDASLVNNDYAYFLTPFCVNGDLDVEISNGIQGNLRAVAIVRDVLAGLSHLHSANLLHRDLKAQNILVDDNSRALIGDFGSVKRIPDGSTTVPGSGHSLAYRPPESVLSQLYGITGDIYQVGILLYQLLGGYFPYEESAWLNKKQLAKYQTIEDFIDKQFFAANCIKKLIVKGKMINMATLPPWVCDPLRYTIRKACNVDPASRFLTCNEFLARLNSIRNDIHDWRIEGAVPVRYGDTKYRIVFDAKRSVYFAEKDKGAGWRKDNTLLTSTISELVPEIENRFK